MSPDGRSKLNTLMSQLEETWGNLNTLFDIITTTGSWDQKHGADWIFADLPYHLAYCNRDLIGRKIELGEDLPADEQELVTSMEALGAWNARKFAQRPADQTVGQSITEWHESCDYLRRLVAGMDDADLQRPFWMSLFQGWTVTEVGLNFVRGHDWSEFIQLRVHMGRTEPIPSPAITRGFLNSILTFMPMFTNQEIAATAQFTAVMAFTDPDVGAWTIHVENGPVTVSEGAADEADLIITQSAETFEKVRQGMIDPAEAIKAGEIKVNSFENLAIYGQIFPS